MSHKFKHGIVFLRKDLRLRDNPALLEATKNCENIGIVYIFDPCEDNPWQLGGASKWWLHHSLKSFDSSNDHLSLNLLHGETTECLEKLIAEWGSEALFWNRCYDPYSIQRDKALKTHFSQKIHVQSFNGSLVREPWEILKKDGSPYLVYSAYWKAFLKTLPVRKTFPKATFTQQTSVSKNRIMLENLELLPKISWDEQFYQYWEPGEKAALRRLAQFSKGNKPESYTKNRDFPSIDGTSLLSPRLHFGELSPVQIWNEILKSGVDIVNNQYLKEIFWREFSYYLLYHYPKTDLEPLKEKYKEFPWDLKENHLRAWQKGETGYPIIDAGMRQLWKTGYMHNRVRMVVASFLIKNLLVPWQEGAKWFFDTLVDADLASNTMGWQWSAGCGADAAPFFRVFNPILQGEKFDKEGLYVKKWVPELSELPKKYIHKPWEADEAILASAGVKLGKTYPKPIVDQKKSREKALIAFKQLNEKT